MCVCVCVLMFMFNKIKYDCKIFRLFLSFTSADNTTANNLCWPRTCSQTTEMLRIPYGASRIVGLRWRDVDGLDSDADRKRFRRNILDYRTTFVAIFQKCSGPWHPTPNNLGWSQDCPDAFQTFQSHFGHFLCKITHAWRHVTGWFGLGRRPETIPLRSWVTAS